MQTWSKPPFDWRQIISQTPLRQPESSWQTNDYPVTLNIKPGFNQFYITYSYADNVRVTQLATIYWNQGFAESRSQVLQTEKNGSIYQFQYILKANGTLSIACRNAGGGNSANFSWIVVWHKQSVETPDIL